MPWLRVSTSRPCKVCQHTDFCTYTADGAQAKCMRVESGKPTKDGGFVHKTGEAPGRAVERRPLPKRAERDWYELSVRCHRDAQVPHFHIARSNMLRLFRDVGSEAQHWGLGVGFLQHPRAYTWPMLNDSCAVIGIRTRSADGKKKAVPGSRAGLFFNVDRSILYGVPVAIICEGPTDTAATMEAMPEAFVVGRPSCIGQEDMLARLLKRVEPALVIVLADNDEKPVTRKMVVRGIGRIQRALADMQVKAPLHVVYPPAKDARDWWRTDPKGMRAALNAVIGEQRAKASV